MTQASQSSDKSKAAGQPNVALIVLDAFRYDQLWRRVRGMPLCPHLGKIAQQGVSFENAISPAPFTGASHASMWTGLLPTEHGASGLDQLTGGALPSPTLPGLLRSAGYLTIALSANPWISRTTALGREFDVMINAPALGGRCPAEQEEPLSRKLARKARSLMRSVMSRCRRQVVPSDCRALLRQAQRMVEAVPLALRAVRGVWPGRPIFLFVNLMATHDPYLFEPQEARFTRPEGVSGPDVTPRRYQPDYWLDLLGVEPIREGKLRRIRWAYSAAAHYADRLAGRIVESIDQCLPPEQTDVIVTADHGELLGEHGFFEHGVFLYEPLVHVPLIIRSSALPAGARAEQAVQTHWIWSYIMDRTGLSDRAGLPNGQGSLRDAARGEGESGPVYSFADPGRKLKRVRVALLEAARRAVDAARVAPKTIDCHIQAVRVENRVLIRTASGRSRAFSIDDRTRERELQGPESEKVVQELSPHLVDISSKNPNAPEGTSGPDEAMLRRLRDLGYTD